MTAFPDNLKQKILSIDTGNEVTIVIGHKNPDSDSVGSAIAFASLLHQLGISAIAAISGKLNSETAYALDAFGISAPVILDNASGKQIILVDHNTYAQAVDGIKDARIIGIIDHHEGGDIRISDQAYIHHALTGASATLVFLAYRACNAEISRNTARVMLMSILSDTRNMKRNVTDADREAYETLKDIAEIEDIDAFYRNMAYALTSYGTLSNREIFETDYKEYEVSGIRFCIADVNAYGEENVIELAEHMDELMALYYDESDLDLMFVIINNKSDDESENMMYMAAFPESAKDLLQKIYGNYDGNRFFIFRKNLSRKTNIVPALTAALKQLTTGTQEKTGITSQ